jgi:hypothetical protein
MPKPDLTFNYNELVTVRNALDTHLRVLMEGVETYRRNNNPEGADAHFKEWQRVSEFREKVGSLVREGAMKKISP